MTITIKTMKFDYHVAPAHADFWAVYRHENGVDYALGLFQGEGPITACHECERSYPGPVETLERIRLWAAHEERFLGGSMPKDIDRLYVSALLDRLENFTRILEKAEGLK